MTEATFRGVVEERRHRVEIGTRPPIAGEIGRRPPIDDVRPGRQTGDNACACFRVSVPVIVGSGAVEKGAEFVDRTSINLLLLPDPVSRPKHVASDIENLFPYYKE